MIFAEQLITVLLLAGCPVQETQVETRDVLDEPRVIKSGPHEVVIFQPQIDSWTNEERSDARSALAVTLAGSKGPFYGSMTFTAASRVDIDSREVLFDEREVKEIRLPGAPARWLTTLTKTVEVARLPDDENWAEVKKNVPGEALTGRAPGFLLDATLRADPDGRQAVLSVDQRDEALLCNEHRQQSVHALGLGRARRPPGQALVQRGEARWTLGIGRQRPSRRLPTDSR